MTFDEWFAGYNLPPLHPMNIWVKELAEAAWHAGYEVGLQHVDDPHVTPYLTKDDNQLEMLNEKDNH